MKIKTQSLILITITALITSCATPLSSEERSIRILRKSDPDKNCKEIGKVHAPGLGSFSDEGREDDLKRATLKVGGNTVSLDKIDENKTHFGTAYRCP